mmetsp:Transcript_16536/g.24875  ORF Transcript_16536/g.24875 Transcript_16536/m.24875 type:complete len:375 (+) Transcript_16536:32-1156(+)
MDGLDTLLKDIEKSKKTTSIRKSTSVSSRADSSDLDTSLTVTHEVEDVLNSFKSFMIDLADTDMRDRINCELDRSTVYSKFIMYYLENAKLSHYTIDTELNRMDFKVIYNGTETTNREEIGDIFYETRLDDIWRFANQSIYADVYIGIENYYKNRDLNISCTASKSMFVVNIDEKAFEARCSFDMVAQSNKAPNDRLKLATIDGVIELSMLNRTIVQWIEAPCISVVFDDDLRNAAHCLIQARAGCFAPSHNFSHSCPENEHNNNDFMTLRDHGHTPIRITTITESIVENVVESFGKWIGADGTKHSSSALSDFDELKATLQKSKETGNGSSSRHGKQGENTSLATKVASKSELEGMSDSVASSGGNDDDWDDW